MSASRGRPGGGNTRPGQPGARRARPTRREPRSDFFAPILAACAPIADLDTAYDAELAVSALLGGAYAAADEDRAGAVARFCDDLLAELAGRDDTLSGALLAGLAAVAPPDARERAAELLAGRKGPAWAAAAGAVTCTSAWAMSDVYGDQTEYILAFEYADGTLGGPPHAVCVLVDFNLGIVKDCWASLHPDGILADCRKSAAEDEDLLLAEVDAATVGLRVAELFAATDRLPTLPEAQGLAEERCAVLARLAVLPAFDGTPTPDASDLAGIVEDFLASPEGELEDAPRAVVEACARLIVEYSLAEHRNDPLRWSPIAVELFLLDWAPRSAVIDEDCTRWLPTVLIAFVTYAGRRSGLPDHAVRATQDAVSEHIPAFAESMVGADTEHVTAAQVARAMIADGVDPTDDTAVRAWLDARMRP
ncbi:hypothetical protein [Actinocatenispora rupis]|uniref:hypothetical protein n=1 Tax=Actinocatenispora rupis TaxID=519421 RepID=UPI00194414B8|nr:hypothetical protein [Actinocatenispora rupis]